MPYYSNLYSTMVEAWLKCLIEPALLGRSSLLSSQEDWVDLSD